MKEITQEYLEDSLKYLVSDNLNNKHRHTLRYFQQECVDATIAAWNERKNIVPYSSMMTGLGKSLTIADLTDKALKKGKRVIQLVPRLELVKQNYEETFNHIDDKKALGICCSKLDRYDMHNQAIVAMYQSFLNRRATSGSFDVCLIDECDNVGNDPDSSYRKIVRSLLRLNPKMLIAGFTATPYKLGQGMLHLPCPKGDNLFTDLVYDTSVYPGIRRLIDEGYLAHVETINTHVKADLSGVRISGIDFNKEQAGVKFDAIIDNAVEEIRQGFKEHDVKTAIIYVSTKKNAEHVFNAWGDPSTMRILHDGLSTKERESLEKWLKEGDGCRYVVNIDIYTRGFNFPKLEAIVMLRATVSPNLLVQIAGRLLRPHKGKIGKFWDFGSNCERLGSIENIVPPSPKKKRGDAPKKVCLLCNTVNILSAKFCKDCGAQFIGTSEEGKYSMRSKAEILAAKSVETYHEISDVLPMLCHSKANGLPMVKLKFHEGFRLVHEEYLMLDHPGGIANKSKVFLREMFKNEKDFYKLGDAGHTVENALIILENHQEYLRTVKGIAVVKTEGDRYKRLARVDYAD